VGRATGLGHTRADGREGDAAHSGIVGPGLGPEGHRSLATTAAYVAVVEVGAGVGAEVMVAAVVVAMEVGGGQAGMQVGWCQLCVG
jgi:hypothetical protein